MENTEATHVQANSRTTGRPPFGDSLGVSCPSWSQQDSNPSR
jgi:hypothetical protein